MTTTAGDRTAHNTPPAASMADPIRRLITVLGAECGSAQRRPGVRISIVEYNNRAAGLQSAMDRALSKLQTRQDEVAKCMGSGTHARSRAALLSYASDHMSDLYAVIVEVNAVMRCLQALATQIDYSIDYHGAHDGWPVAPDTPI